MNKPTIKEYINELGIACKNENIDVPKVDIQERIELNLDYSRHSRETG